MPEHRERIRDGHHAMSTSVIVRDLYFRYADGTAVLNGISFAVAAGERVAVLGANGAGKSTLLLHFNGLLSPDTGSITIGEATVNETNAAAIRRRVGLVFQDPDDQLFLPTLIEDIAFGPMNAGIPPETAGAMAAAELQRLGLAAMANKAAHHLSGGEKRLASLATVLVSEPDVLVLDEPTNSLDARGRRTIVDTLRARSETMILATHDLEVAKAVCSRAIVLCGGRVAADLPIAEALGDQELLVRYGLVFPLR